MKVERAQNIYVDLELVSNVPFRSSEAPDGLESTFKLFNRTWACLNGS